MQVSPAIRLSPVPGFPILPVPDYVPRLVLLDPRSPVFRPGFPILPVPDYVLRPVPVVLLDEVKTEHHSICLSLSRAFGFKSVSSVERDNYGTLCSLH